MSILMNLLSNSGYIIVNKEIIKKIGLHEAIIIGELCSEYTYWEKANKLDNGYFFSTRENIEENTGLSAYQQREAFKRLAQMGIVLERLKGMPQQKWYSLDMEKLYDLLNKGTSFITSSEEIKDQGIKKFDTKILKNLIINSKETEHLDVKKLDTNNNNNNKKNNKEEIIKFKDKIYMTTSQYQELIEKYGKYKVEKTITRLDLYKKSTGKKYSDDYSTLLLWIDEDIEKENKYKENNFKTKKNSKLIEDLREKYGNNLEKLYANYETTNN